MNRDKKVFVIGHHKTGTTSLHQMLKTLYYEMFPNVQGYALMKASFTHDLNGLALAAQSYTGFDDSPWNHPNVYKYMDQVFPKSQFVLTTRDEEGWFKSLSATLRTFNYHQNYDHLPIHGHHRTWVEYPGGYTAKDFWMHMYGVCPSNEEELQQTKPLLLAAYRKHNKEVQEYFERRYKTDHTKKLLVMNLGEGCGYPELCSFLGKPLLYAPTPRMNVTLYNMGNNGEDA